MIRKFKITHKMAIIFILVGFVPLLVGILIVNAFVTSTLKADAIERLQVKQKAKVMEVEKWGAQHRKSIEFVAKMEIVSRRFQILKQYHDRMEVNENEPFPVNSEEYKSLWEEISPQMMEIQNQFDFYDIFIICAAHGHVMYTNAKESDLGANLMHGDLKDSNLAKVWREAKETRKTTIIDFEPYTPSQNQYASFLATPFYNKQDGSLLGILAIQIPPDEINTFMHDRTGMGETGESYLVGKYNDKISFRNDMITMGEGKYVFGYQIETDYIKKAIAGKTGYGIFVDSSGNDVLVVYSPLDIPGLNWACVSKINMDETLKSAIRLKNILFILLAAMGVLVVVLSRLIAGGIAKPIKQIASISDSLGEGDLTHQLNSTSRDELGDLSRSLNRSMEKLSGIIKTVQDGSNDIINSADELAVGSNDLASRTQQQAASITETTATIEEFSKAVKQNTENSVDLNTSMQSFNTTLQSNKRLVEDVSATMQEITDSSKQIDAIVNVINDISFQTNLLALNAAIEAARAGEAGRGFAVVASEVRNLAQKTAESSKTIQDIVTKNVQSTQQGMELVQKTTDSFGQIVTMMEELVEKITQISSASSEQSTGIEQINTAISQMDEVVNYNASLSEEFSASSNNLKQNAQQLQSLVEQFKIQEED